MDQGILEELEEAIGTDSTWMVAGGSVLSIACNKPINDVDIFSPGSTEEIANKLIRLAPEAQVQRMVTVTRVGNIDIVHLDSLGDFAATVLGSFDFNVVSCGYVPKIGFVASEECLQGFETGTLDLTSWVDPWTNPLRTAHRAGKFMGRLRWQVGPRLTSFLKEYHRRGMPIYKPTNRTVINPITLAPYKVMRLIDLQKSIRPSWGPCHPLEVMLEQT